MYPIVTDNKGRRNDVIKKRAPLKNNLKNDAWVKLGRVLLSLSLSLPMEFYSPWKENKVYTPLGLETIKVSGIDLKRRCWPRTAQRSREEKKKEGRGGLLRAVRSINGGRRTTGHGGS